MAKEPGHGGAGCMLFVDWSTGQRFWGKLIADPMQGVKEVLEFYREGHSEEGFIVDRLSTGSIAILEASNEELLSLRDAGYRLSID